MQNKIKILEEDIFKFVFNRESLAKEKLDYLNKNQNVFEEEIELCKELNSTENGSDESITAKVISRLQHQNVVELYPREDVHFVKQGIRLVAASALLKQSKLPTSFSDANHNYLIRLVSTNNQLLLYFFSKDEGKKQYRIKFMPSEKEYFINDSSKPIEILEEKDIQMILIDD